MALVNKFVKSALLPVTVDEDPAYSMRIAQRFYKTDVRSVSDCPIYTNKKGVFLWKLLDPSDGHYYFACGSTVISAGVLSQVSSFLYGFKEASADQIDLSPEEIFIGQETGVQTSLSETSALPPLSASDPSWIISSDVSELSGQYFKTGVLANGQDVYANANGKKLFLAVSEDPETSSLVSSWTIGDNVASKLSSAVAGPSQLVSSDLEEKETSAMSSYLVEENTEVLDPISGTPNQLKSLSSVSVKRTMTLFGRFLDQVYGSFQEVFENEEVQISASYFDMWGNSALISSNQSSFSDPTSCTLSIHPTQNALTGVVTNYSQPTDGATFCPVSAQASSEGRRFSLSGVGNALMPIVSSDLSSSIARSFSDGFLQFQITSLMDYDRDFIAQPAVDAQSSVVASSRLALKRDGNSLVQTVIQTAELNVRSQTTEPYMESDEDTQHIIFEVRRAVTDVWTYVYKIDQTDFQDWWDLSGKPISCQISGAVPSGLWQDGTVSALNCQITLSQIQAELSSLL